MDALLKEYLPILIFLGVAIGLSLAMVIGSYLVAPQRPDSEMQGPIDSTGARAVNHLSNKLIMTLIGG